MNMRMQELGAVLDRMDGSPLKILFGTGWGGTFESPAVGGMSVNFTHSLISAYLLKTGLLGLAAVLVYLTAVAGRLYRLFFRMPVTAAALAAPLFVDTFLYASYKSLDFGLILMLICLWADDRCTLKDGVRYSN